MHGNKCRHSSPTGKRPPPFFFNKIVNKKRGSAPQPLPDGIRTAKTKKRPQTSRSAGVFVVRTPLSVDLVQQARQAVSAAQELFLDDGRVFENVVVLDLRALGARSIDLLAGFVRLLRPVGGLSGRDPGFFLVGQPVDLLLPLGVAPVVSRFGQVRVPDRMQVGFRG